QVDFGGTGAGAAMAATGAMPEIEAVTATSSLAASLAAAAGNGSAGLAATVCGGAASARGAEVQNHTPAMTTAATTLASIRPNALRIVTLSKNATKPTYGMRHLRTGTFMQRKC